MQKLFISMAANLLLCFAILKLLWREHSLHSEDSRVLSILRIRERTQQRVYFHVVTHASNLSSSVAVHLYIILMRWGPFNWSWVGTLYMKRENISLFLISFLRFLTLCSCLQLFFCDDTKCLFECNFMLIFSLLLGSPVEFTKKFVFNIASFLNAHLFTSNSLVFFLSFQLYSIL